MSMKNLHAEERLIIAIDNGKMNMKIKCGDEEIVYKNRFSIGHTDDENLLGEYTYNVTYKNQDYTIGDNAKKSDKNEGKGSQEQIVQALTAITRFIKPIEKRPIYIMYGESVDYYFRDDQKESIKNSLEGNHTIQVNDETYMFNVELVQVLPEGIGYILENLSDLLGVQYVVDIGGGTINFLTVDNGRPSPEDSFSYLLGVNNILAKSISQIKRKTTMGALPDKMLLSFIMNPDSCQNKELRSIIDQVITEQFKELDDKLAGVDINIHDYLKAQRVYFVGGGAELFRNFLEKYYHSEVCNQVVVDEPLFANVRGFYAYGVSKFALQEQ